MKKVLFLDRDGVINEVVKRYNKLKGKIIDDSPFNISELKFRKGIPELFSAARRRGYKLVVVTNQPSILKGGFTMREYEEITTEICNKLDLSRSDIFDCFHKEGYSLECLCRKPKGGLFLMAKGLFDINLNSSIMIGDSWKDMVAAKSVGVGKTIFLRRIKKKEELGNSEDEQVMSKENIVPDFIVNDFNEIIKIINV